MRSRFLLAGLTGLLALVGMLGVVSGSSAASPVWPLWGNAAEVPGSAALNSGGQTTVYSMACAAAGECAAGGVYKDGSNHYQAFVVSEKNGVWGSAVEVPGTAALNSGGLAEVYSVSCGAVGDCTAGGTYKDGSGNGQAFVVSETNGVWGDAVEVPGTAALNGGGQAQVSSVSCSAAGDCTAGGLYFDGSYLAQAFVVSETNGVWGDAVEVPGTAALNSGGQAQVGSVSCSAAGDCTAGGLYTDGSDHAQAFVATETNGVWGDAVEVPGTAALNQGTFAAVYTVSCASAGNCAAGGRYKDASGHRQAWVASESNGVWGNAVEVPGMAALNKGGFTSVDTLSCPASGDCAGGGSYLDGSGHFQAFLVSEKNGVWGSAVEVPGTANLNLGGSAWVSSVSCAAVGDCVAGGAYSDASKHGQAFVVDETNGAWGSAIELPGTAALNKGGGAGVGSVSCGAAGACAAGGSYTDGSGHYQAFVASSAAKTAPPCLVPDVVGKTLGAAKKALTASDCAVGKIKTTYSRTAKGHVVAQNPKTGQQLANGSKVALTVSKGKK